MIALTPEPPALSATGGRVASLASAAILFLLCWRGLPELLRPVFASVLAPTRMPSPHSRLLVPGLVGANDLTVVASTLTAASLVLLAVGRWAGVRHLAAFSNLPRTRRHARQLAFGVVAGSAAMGAIMLALALSGCVAIAPTPRPAAQLAGSLAVWALVFAMVGLAEEIGSRGPLQRLLTEGFGFWGATALTSIWFAMLHLLGGDPWWGALSTGLRAVFFCLTLRITGALGFAIGFHAAWDYTQSAIFGVPDSSWIVASSLLRTTLSGPTPLAGGAVGPEGSVFAYIVSIALLAAAMLLVAHRPRPVQASAIS